MRVSSLAIVGVLSLPTAIGMTQSEDGPNLGGQVLSELEPSPSVAVASETTASSHITPRPPPDEPDTQHLYEDFGNFGIGAQYPLAAARLGKQGWVLIEFAVDTKGCVSKVEVVDASPPGLFEEAVTSQFVNRCFPHPKIVDGKPVEVSGIQWLTKFVLKD